MTSSLLGSLSNYIQIACLLWHLGWDAWVPIFLYLVWRDRLRSLLLRKHSYRSYATFSSFCGSGVMVRWSVTSDGLCADSWVMITEIFVYFQSLWLLTFRSQMRTKPLYIPKSCGSNLATIISLGQSSLNCCLPPHKQVYAGGHAVE